MKSPAAMALSMGLSVILSRAKNRCSVVLSGAKNLRGAAKRHGLRTRPAFTLIEVLMATAIAMLLMAGIVTLFASVSESVSRGQAMMETGDRLRGAQHRLQTDLKYHTAPLVPTLDPRNGLGYFEILEGPGPYQITGAGVQPINTENGTDDTTVGDLDDGFMFTARSYGEPFVGRWGAGAIQSQVAEICWFVRGTTLYRRVLLVTPERIIPPNWYTGGNSGMYYFADVSVHQEGGAADSNAGWNSAPTVLVANSLGDLTKRENRYGHWPRYAGHAIEGYPHNVRFWGSLGLPTLRESSDPNWPFPLFGNAPTIPSGIPAPTQNDYWLTQTPNDFWQNPHAGLDPDTGALPGYTGNRNPERVAEDVVLNNVLSFDVKVWDPTAPVLLETATGHVHEPGDLVYRSLLDDLINGRPTTSVVRRGAYVDLYYARGLGAAAEQASTFSGRGMSHLQAAPTGAAIWDTFSNHYESDGVDQNGDGIVDNANDGLDNNGIGGVDDATERETAPPYEAPIRSIQIKIRVYERDTRQIREVTVTQDFVQ